MEYEGLINKFNICKISTDNNPHEQELYTMGMNKNDRNIVSGENTRSTLTVEETKGIKDMYQPCDQDKVNEQINNTFTTPKKRFGINKKNPRRKLF